VNTIKETVYDGDIAIANTARNSTTDRTMRHISDELRQVAGGVGGNNVKKSDDRLIITQGGVSISRSKLGH
jgi:SepF-like predicted cell division protein (DUF552 family)